MQVETMTQEELFNSLPDEEKEVVRRELKTLSPILIGLLQNLSTNYLQLQKDNAEMRTDLKTIKDVSLKVVETLGMYKDGQIVKQNQFMMVTSITAKMPGIIKSVLSGDTSDYSFINNMMPVIAKYKDL